MANLSGYNFAYLDEQTKRMIRRAILKAVAIPGYQVPFGGREMPMPYGWGTGGIQITASVIGEADVLLSNFKPGTLDALGFDRATLERTNPRLVSVDSGNAAQAVEEAVPYSRYEDSGIRCLVQRYGAQAPL